MSKSPSFDRVNYLLRPNKHIERKLIFDRLMRMRSQISFINHRYIGLGSLWFVDFVLAHRALQVTEMLSIECEAEIAPRMEFNKPYSTIEVRAGFSIDVLSEMVDAEWSRPHVVWLDYDGCLDEMVVQDLDLLLRRLAPNSVLIISINANRKSYRPPTGQPGINSPSLNTISELVGSDTPPTHYQTVGAGAYKDVSDDEFPAFLADTILNLMKRKFRLSGRQEGETPLQFLPAFNFCHHDGTNMVTLGGVICPPERCTKLTGELPELAAPLNEAGNISQTLLNLSQLTAKEKITLDRLLPFDGEDFEQRAEAAGLRLAPEEYDKYRAHYLHFPVFTESFF